MSKTPSEEGRDRAEAFQSIQSIQSGLGDISRGFDFPAVRQSRTTVDLRGSQSQPPQSQTAAAAAAETGNLQSRFPQYGSATPWGGSSSNNSATGIGPGQPRASPSHQRTRPQYNAGVGTTSAQRLAPERMPTPQLRRLITPRAADISQQSSPTSAEDIRATPRTTPAFASQVASPSLSSQLSSPSPLPSSPGGAFRRLQTWRSSPTQRLQSQDSRARSHSQSSSPTDETLTIDDVFAAKQHLRPDHPHGYPQPPAFEHNWVEPNRRGAHKSVDPRRARFVGPPLGSQEGKAGQAARTRAQQQQPEHHSQPGGGYFEVANTGGGNPTRPDGTGGPPWFPSGPSAPIDTNPYGQLSPYEAEVAERMRHDEALRRADRRAQGGPAPAMPVSDDSDEEGGDRRMTSSRSGI